MARKRANPRESDVTGWSNLGAPTPRPSSARSVQKKGKKPRKNLGALFPPKKFFFDNSLRATDTDTGKLLLTS
jgi:hypothetical protein